jgi:ribosomal protein S18 acetylase RimI-like enzyme
MKISYYATNPNRDDFFELFMTTGWNKKYKLGANELIEALKNSWFRISAYDGDKLIGYGRIIADGIVHALLLDIIIHPDYQGKNIGKEILEILVQKCKKHNIRDIQLFCAKDKVGFYEKYGFITRPDNAPGMEYDWKNTIKNDEC